MRPGARTGSEQDQEQQDVTFSSKRRREDSDKREHEKPGVISITLG